MSGQTFPSNSIILVLETSDLTREDMKRQLSALGYNYVIDARDGKGALTKLEVGSATGAPVSLLICGWQEENQDDTLAVLKSIRKASHSKQLPVMMSVTSQGLSKMLFTAGPEIHGYVVHPLTSEQLKKSLEAVWVRR